MAALTVGAVPAAGAGLAVFAVFPHGADSQRHRPGQDGNDNDLS